MNNGNANVSIDRSQSLPYGGSSEVTSRPTNGMRKTSKPKASSTAQIHPYETAATISYLETLSSRLMEAHGPIHHPSAESVLRNHCSPDFEIVFTNSDGPLPPAKNLDTHIANLQALKRKHPDLCIMAQNPTAELNKNGVDAVVWLTVRGCSVRTKEPAISAGAAPGGDYASIAANDQLYNRESIAYLSWRKRTTDGKWICYRHVGLRGGGDMFT